MTSGEHPRRWREVVDRLRRGPAPRGERFDACRALLASAPTPADRGTAVRVLLEGAMADAATDIADAQEIMAVLRAADRGTLELESLAETPR